MVTATEVKSKKLRRRTPSTILEDLSVSKIRLELDRLDAKIRVKEKVQKKCRSVEDELVKIEKEIGSRRHTQIELQQLQDLVSKANDEISVYKKELEDIRQDEKAQAELDKIYQVKLWWMVEKDKHIRTPQSKRDSWFLKEFQWLALYKGRQGSDLFLSFYSNDDEQRAHALELENQLHQGTWVGQQRETLKRYLR